MHLTERFLLGRRLVPLLLLAVATLCAHSGAGKADDRPDEAGRTRRLEKMKRVATQFTLFLGEDRKRPLDLVEAPVMRWTNPENLAKDGTIFLWTRSGRPQAVLGLYTYDDDHFS